MQIYKPFFACGVSLCKERHLCLTNEAVKYSKHVPSQWYHGCRLDDRGEMMILERRVICKWWSVAVAGPGLWLGGTYCPVLGSPFGYSNSSTKCDSDELPVYMPNRMIFQDLRGDTVSLWCIPTVEDGPCDGRCFHRSGYDHHEIQRGVSRNLKGIKKKWLK